MERPKLILTHVGVYLKNDEQSVDVGGYPHFQRNRTLAPTQDGQEKGDATRNKMGFCEQLENNDLR